MLLSLLLDTLCGHKLLDSYARGRKSSLWLRPTAINFLFVLILCSSVSPYGVEVIMPFSFLSCFASSLGQGMLCALPIVQQGCCDHSVLYSHLTPWSQSILSSQMMSLGSKHCMCGDSCDTASYSNGMGQHAGLRCCGEQMQVLEDREQRRD